MIWVLIAVGGVVWLVAATGLGLLAGEMVRLAHGPELQRLERLMDLAVSA